MAGGRLEPGPAVRDERQRAVVEHRNREPLRRQAPIDCPGRGVPIHGGSAAPHNRPVARRVGADIAGARIGRFDAEKVAQAITMDPAAPVGDRGCSFDEVGRATSAMHLDRVELPPGWQLAAMHSTLPMVIEASRLFAAHPGCRRIHRSFSRSRMGGARYIFTSLTRTVGSTLV
jgi:hypothetical protein